MTLELTIDGKPAAAQPGESLLEVTRRHGAEVPSLCHHPLLEAYGACRVCLVEVTKAGRPKITTSCNYEVQAGIAVATNTLRVRSHRKMSLELLLALAPEAKAVQGLARAYGVTTPRFALSAPPGGRKNCILCGLCARACDRVVKASAIGLAGRGDHRRLEVPFGDELASSCIGCGACASVCPTGAIELESVKVARLRKSPATARECRYALMGLMPGALCPNNYDCARCEVDQRLVAATRPHHPVFAARGLHVPAAWEE